MWLLGIMSACACVNLLSSTSSFPPSTPLTCPPGPELADLPKRNQSCSSLSFVAANKPTYTFQSQSVRQRNWMYLLLQAWLSFYPFTLCCCCTCWLTRRCVDKFALEWHPAKLLTLIGNLKAYQQILASYDMHFWVFLMPCNASSSHFVSL